MRPAWLEINLSAIADNISNLKPVLGPQRQIIAVIKDISLSTILVAIQKYGLSGQRVEVGCAQPAGVITGG